MGGGSVKKNFFSELTFPNECLVYPTEDNSRVECIQERFTNMSPQTSVKWLSVKVQMIKVKTNLKEEKNF